MGACILQKRPDRRFEKLGTIVIKIECAKQALNHELRNPRENSFNNLDTLPLYAFEEVPSLKTSRKVGGFSKLTSYVPNLTFSNARALNTRRLVVRSRRLSSPENLRQGWGGFSKLTSYTQPAVVTWSLGSSWTLRIFEPSILHRVRLPTISVGNTRSCTVRGGDGSTCEMKFDLRGKSRPRNHLRRLTASIAVGPRRCTQLAIQCAPNKRHRASSQHDPAFGALRHPLDEEHPASPPAIISPVAAHG